MGTLEFDVEAHAYRVRGRVIQSVTQRIQAAGLVSGSHWFTPEAADRGTAVHLACADHDLGRSITLPDAWRGYLTSYAKWVDAMRPAWSKVEVPTWSEKYNTAGTADRIGEIRGTPVVVDLKTGAKSSGTWHGVQLAIYDLIYDDIEPRKRRRIALYLRANGAMAQSVEFSSTYDYTVALKLCAPSQETPDATDHLDPTSPPDLDDGPTPTSGD
jgi:hypothetical protein